MQPVSQTQPELVFKNTTRGVGQKRTFGNSYHGLFGNYLIYYSVGAPANDL
jgi:hypothetical protein